MKEAFDRAGIEMPEPIERVRVESAAERPTPAAAPSGAVALDTSRDAHLDREVDAERATGPPDLLRSDEATE